MSNVSPPTDTTRTEALEQRVADLEGIVHEMRAALVGAGAALALGYASGNHPKGATAASALSKVTDAANAEADAIEAVRRLNAAKGEGAGR